MYINKITLPKKFYQNKPLKKVFSPNYPEKYILKYDQAGTIQKNRLYQLMECQFLEVIDFDTGFYTKAGIKSLLRYDFLWCPECPALIVSRRIISILNSICPRDYQSIPIQIRNEDETYDQNFYLINVLNFGNVIDKENSNIIYYKSPPGWFDFNSIIFKENCMGTHHLLRDKFYSPIIFFSPELARQFANNKEIKFLSDEEASQYM